MFLKSLEIQGFKSFPDKTVLTFGRGVTAVVGPNGSGKSNISDAIRWVLGEMSTKTLRGSRMEDVIFGGTVTRKPTGFAEVSLTVDNAERELALDSDEVTVTRRYYRSGESEYLLNRNEVRLRDIHELLMDTGLGRDGYSVIGQGRITEIVSAKSEDRREIFEEAAGIAKYRYRKEESERRLAATEENLVRLRDIETELSDRLGPLAEQAEKARQYVGLAAEKKNLEVGLWLFTLDRQKDVLREQDNRLSIARTQYERAQRQADEASSAIEQAYFESQKTAAGIEECRGAAGGFEEQAAKKDADAAILRNDIAHNDENIRRIRGEIEQTRQAGEDIERRIAEKKQEIEALEADGARLEEELAACEKSVFEIAKQGDAFAGKIDGLSAQMSRTNAEITEQKIAQNGAASTLVHLRSRLGEIGAALLECGEHRRAAQESLAACAKDLAACAEKIEGLGNSLKGYELKLDSRRQKLRQTEESVRALTLECAGKSQRAHMLGDLEKNLEGFAHSVRAVMREKAHGTLSGIRGPVSRLIDVPSRYAVAIETALGGAIQHIVVDHEESAKSAIAFLKRSDAGRATFLPLTAVHGSELRENGLDRCAGYVGLASGLISCDPAYAGVVRSLLGRTVVAEDLDGAVAIARRYGYRFRIVTLDGQLVNAGGSMTGGSLNRNAGLLSRREEIQTLLSQAETLEQRIRAEKERQKEISAETASLEAAVSGIRGEATSAQEDRIRLEGEEKRLREQAAAADAQAQQLTVEKERAEESIAEAEQTVQQTQLAVAALTGQLDALQAQLEELGGSRGELTRRREAQAQQLGDLKLRRLTCEKDADSARLAAAGLENQQTTGADRAQELAEQAQALEEENGRVRSQIEALGEQAQALRGQAEEKAARAKAMIARREEIERGTVELRTKERALSEEKEKLSKELARLEERKAAAQSEYDTVIARLWDEYELTRTEAEKVAEPVAEPAKVQKRLIELKSRIRQLGSVNVGAIEEYKEVRERYDFLSAQIADIEKSKCELGGLIDDLTARMRDIFSEKFREINRNFSETFVELFGGGSARLELSDPEHVLESGIEIVVQPPGKIIKSLTALSGGEQSFIAIALYFAILKVNPSPFCVLDEIEAALDDANVARFAAYLQKMCDSTQFIVITHRRGTKDAADVLYGVTMQDEGVSKLLSLHVSELMERLGLRA